MRLLRSCVLTVLLIVLRAQAHAQPVDAGVADPSSDASDAGVADTPPDAVDAADAPVDAALPPPSKPAAVTPSSPFSAADMRGAPLPGQEHGRTDEIDSGDGFGRYLLRALLVVPRIPMELVFQPLRALLYLNERFHAVQNIVELFVTDDRKTAIFPTAFIETGFGLNAGIRAHFKDLLGGDETISMRAAIGGRLRRVASFEMKTNKHGKSPIFAGIELKYETRDRERFFGYGNGDIVDVGMPIDPLTSDAATSARFAVEALRASPRLGVRLSPRISATLSGTLTRKTYDVVANEPIDEAFMIDRVPGFERGTTFIYSELKLAYDSRRPAHRWDHPGIYGTGGLALAYAGRQQGFRDGEIGFYRIGIDLQRVIRLTIGPRAIELRAYGELVTGARDEIPFTELPRLGGTNLLRGYPPDRFRDRLATVGQVTYRWSVGNDLAASLFSDIGRVHTGLDDLSLHGMRVGYGVALEGYTTTSMFIRAEVASSIDGGLFIYVSLNPVTDDLSRVERY